MTYADHSKASIDGPSDIAKTERERRLRRLQTVAALMDTAIGIPGTNIRLGADSILGLVPVVGDVGSALIGLAIVNEARRLGVPKAKLAKMLTNIGLDAAVGSVPLLGDVFDVFFKSHRKNVQLILEHFKEDHRVGLKPR
jgi:hypothetical protein